MSDIVDNTLLKKTSPDSQTSAFTPYTVPQQQTRPGILRNNTDTTRSKVSGHVTDRTVQIHSPPSDHSRSTGSGYQKALSSQSVSSNLIGSSFGSVNERPNPIGQYLKPYVNKASHDSRYSSLEGFNSVREALLRTSSAIKDIDHILEKR